MKSFFLILLSIILFSCNGSGNHPVNVTHTLGIDNYKPMPSNAQVLLFGDIADSINALIPKLDKNAFREGRSAVKAYDRELAKNLVEEAQSTGGITSAGTIFKGKYSDDHIAVSLHTEYHKPSLKLLKEWEQKSPAGYTETMYTYSAKIKIHYTVDVDGNSETKIYTQSSQFTTAIKFHK